MIRSRRLAGAILSAAALAGVPGFALGQVSGTWVNPLSGQWRQGVNWTSNPDYPKDGGIATFGTNTLNSITVSGVLDSMSRLVFDGPARYTVTGTGLILVGPAVIDVRDPDNSGPSMIGGHTISSPIYGTAGLVKEGPGILSIGSQNVHSGGTTVNEGTLIFANGSSFGSGSIVLNGGAIRGTDAASYPLWVPIHVTENGGTIASTGGTQSRPTIGSPISGNGQLLLGGHLINGSTQGLTLSGDSPFSGTLAVQTQAVITGSFNSAAAVEVSNAIWLRNSDLLLQRISDSASIRLRGGGIYSELLESSGADSTERVGDIVVSAGINVLGDSKLKFIVHDVVRDPRGILRIRSGIQISGNAPTLSGNGTVNNTNVGIVPWVHSLDTSALPVTVTGSGLMRTLDASEYVTSVPQGVSDVNLRLSSPTIISEPVTVNSLTFLPGFFPPHLSGTGTVTVSSGAVFMAPGGLIYSDITAPLHFGNKEGIIHTASEPGAAISGPISGTGGLTIPGYLVLSGMSTYSGPTTIHGQAVIKKDVLIDQPGPLGMDSSPILIEYGGTAAFRGYPYSLGGVLSFNSSSGSIQFERDLIFRGYGTQVGGIGFQIGHGGPPFQPVEISGNIDIEGDIFLAGSYAFPITVSGQISGPGRIIDIGGVILTGANSFSGGLVLGSAGIIIGSNTAFGTGTLWIAGNGTISSTASFTLNNPVVIQADARIGGSQPIGFSGPIDLFGGTRTIELVNSATTTFSGPIFNGSLVKTGSGNMQIRRVNVSTFTVNTGAVQVLPDSTPSFVRRLSIAPGASLDLTNNSLILNSPAVTTIKSYLTDGRLFSSMAVPETTTLGYGRNSVLGYSIFDGQPVSATANLIKYTFFGDANLDGTVNLRDLMMFASGWQTDGPWTSGDFNHDGIVNHTDLGLLARNWQAGGETPLGPALEDLGLPPIPVPEPVAVAGFSVVIFFRRRNLHRNGGRIG